MADSPPRIQAVTTDTPTITGLYTTVPEIFIDAIVGGAKGNGVVKVNFASDRFDPNSGNIIRSVVISLIMPETLVRSVADAMIAIANTPLQKDAKE